MTHTRPIVTHTKRALLFVAAASLAACTSSTAGASSAPLVSLAPPSVAVVVPSTAPTAETTPSAAPSEAPSEAVAESAGPTAVPTTIDPCQVVTPAEASTLAGVKLGPGSATTAENNARICSYGSAQDGLIFSVIVTAAADAATAKAQEPAFKTQIEQGAATAGLADMKLTEITDFQPGVDAAVLTGSTTFAGKKIEGVAFYALKNAVLLAITDLHFGGTAPTAQAVEDEAKIALDRLP